VLAGVVEPPKEYDREGLREYDHFTPLNRMVDAVPPESDCAREFRSIAKRIADGTATSADRRQARQWLTLWRDNDAELQPILEQSALTLELVPVSHNLAQAATIGLASLDELDARKPVSAAVHKERLASLKAMEAPRAVLLNMVVSGIEVIVATTGH
jgi:hexosaminidase